MSCMQPNDKSALFKKIAALRAKTTAAGCTQAEAMAAAEVAARLMAEHGISDATIGTTEARAKARKDMPAWEKSLAVAIGDNLNCSPLVEMRLNGSDIRFFGRDPAPDIAAYLWTVCRRAVRRELALFHASRRYKDAAARRRASHQFIDGMCLTMRVRLKALFADTRSSEALGVARAAVREIVPDARSGAGRRMRHAALGKITAAAIAGCQAGASVTIARGVDKDAKRALT